MKERQQQADIHKQESHDMSRHLLIAEDAKMGVLKEKEEALEEAKTAQEKLRCKERELDDMRNKLTEQQQEKNERDCQFTTKIALVVDALLEMEGVLREIGQTVEAERDSQEGREMEGGKEELKEEGREEYTHKELNVEAEERERAEEHERETDRERERKREDEERIVELERLLAEGTHEKDEMCDILKETERERERAMETEVNTRRLMEPQLQELLVLVTQEQVTRMHMSHTCETLTMSYYPLADVCIGTCTKHKKTCTY